MMGRAERLGFLDPVPSSQEIQVVPTVHVFCYSESLHGPPCHRVSMSPRRVAFAAKMETSTVIPKRTTALVKWGDRRCLVSSDSC
jgi:hypothetical protein